MKIHFQRFKLGNRALPRRMQRPEKGRCGQRTTPLQRKGEGQAPNGRRPPVTWKDVERENEGWVAETTSRAAIPLSWPPLLPPLLRHMRRRGLPTFSFFFFPRWIRRRRRKVKTKVWDHVGTVKTHMIFLTPSLPCDRLSAIISSYRFFNTVLFLWRRSYRDRWFHRFEQVEKISYVLCEFVFDKTIGRPRKKKCDFRWKDGRSHHVRKKKERNMSLRLQEHDDRAVVLFLSRVWWPWNSFLNFFRSFRIW